MVFIIQIYYPERKEKNIRKTRNKKEDTDGFQSHYYDPKDIHLKTHKAELRQKLKCWICGKEGHTAYHCPENDAARKHKGKLSEQRAKEYREKKNSRDKKVRFGCNRCGNPSHDTNDCPQGPFNQPKLEAHPLQAHCFLPLIPAVLEMSLLLMKTLL
jgi:hypothetical protein